MRYLILAVLCIVVLSGCGSDTPLTADPEATETQPEAMEALTEEPQAAEQETQAAEIEIDPLPQLAQPWASFDDLEDLASPWFPFHATHERFPNGTHWKGEFVDVEKLSGYSDVWGLEFHMKNHNERILVIVDLVENSELRLPLFIGPLHSPITISVILKGWGWGKEPEAWVAYLQAIHRGGSWLQMPEQPHHEAAW